jgi:hypothetical protein
MYSLVRFRNNASEGTYNYTALLLVDGMYLPERSSYTRRVFRRAHPAFLIDSPRGSQNKTFLSFALFCRQNLKSTCLRPNKTRPSRV